MEGRYDDNRRELPSALAAEVFRDVYVIQRSARDPHKWDVVRNAPTIISSELRQAEAEALAFAMNVQIKTLEGRNEQ